MRLVLDIRAARAGALLLALVAGSVTLADDNESGWMWGVNCPAEGTFGSANFTASTSAFSGSGNCARTSTQFTQFTFTSSSGGTLNSSTLYALNTGDLLILPPTLTTETMPIFATQTYCPVANATLNWIFVQWGDTWNAALGAGDTVAGTASWDTTSGLSVTGEYNVSGSALWTGTSSLPATVCTPGGNGIYSPSGVGDRGGTMYVTASAGGVYKTADHAALFFPQYTTTLATDLGSKTGFGIAFDSVASSDTKNVQLTANSTGTVLTVKPYSDVSAGTIDGSYTDTITISAANSPVSGMLTATIARTGTGAGSGTLVCILNKDFDIRVICSGTSPSNNNYPYTLTLTVPGSCPTNYIRVPKNFDVGVYHDFCVMKYETSQGPKVQGKFTAVSQTGAAPWVSLNRDTAITNCQAIGTGYDLVTNAEWQAMARDIETAYSGGSYLNWSNGSPSGSNFINMGNSSSGAAFAAAADGSPCSGTSFPNCADNTSSDWTNKRTHQLSNGNIIWDLAGNVDEWVKDNNTSSQGGDNYAAAATWSGAAQAMWGPSTTYSGKSTGNYGGLGYQVLNALGGAIVRGGYWLIGVDSGIYDTALNHPATDTATFIGYRCAYHP